LGALWNGVSCAVPLGEGTPFRNRSGARRKRRRGYRSSTNRAQYGSHDSRHRWNAERSGNSKARGRTPSFRSPQSWISGRNSESDRQPRSGHHSRNARQRESRLRHKTGLGERSHLLSKSIDLDVFVTDIANVIRYEDLNDVVLVGHSFGGNSISGVADVMRDRIRQLIYLDAVILENGQSVFSQLPKDVVEARTKAAQETSGGLSIPAPPPAAFGITDAVQTQFVQSRFTPHPFNTFVSPLKLANKVGNGLPTTYIICADPIYKPLEASRNWVKAAGWKTIEIQCGHDAMVIAPDRLADLLDADAA